MREGAPCDGDRELWKANLEMPRGRWATGYPGLVLGPLREWLWARASELGVIGGRGGARNTSVYEWLRSLKEEKGTSHRG